jgi:excisionase family DNA binding protein
VAKTTPTSCPNCGHGFKRLYTYEQASTYSGISIRRLRERVAENRIPFKKEGTLVLLEVSDLDAYIDRLPTEKAAS